MAPFSLKQLSELLGGSPEKRKRLAELEEEARTAVARHCAILVEAGIQLDRLTRLQLAMILGVEEADTVGEAMAEPPCSRCVHTDCVFHPGEGDPGE